MMKNGNMRATWVSSVINLDWPNGAVIISVRYGETLEFTGYSLIDG